MPRRIQERREATFHVAGSIGSEPSEGEDDATARFSPAPDRLLIRISDTLASGVCRIADANPGQDTARADPVTWGPLARPLTTRRPSSVKGRESTWPPGVAGMCGA